MPEASFNWNIGTWHQKAAPIAEPAAFAADAELDQAIDDLRRVLKKDGEADFAPISPPPGRSTGPWISQRLGSADSAGFGGISAPTYGNPPSARTPGLPAGISMRRRPPLKQRPAAE